MTPPDAAVGRVGAMLSLLDDPDPTVRAEVERALEQEGLGVVPALRVVAEGSNPSAAAQAAVVMRQIGIESFLAALGPILARSEGAVLEDGALALCRLHTPDLDEAPVRAELDRLAERLAPSLDGVENGLGTMRECNRFLLDVEGFGPCGHGRLEYYNPENSYLHRILDRRIAIPVGLGLLYLLVGERLGLPLAGVNYPAHFILLYRDEARSFYVDPFNDGQFLDEQECRATLRGLGIEIRAEYLQPVTERRMLARMMRNLMAIYREPWPRAADVLERAMEELDR